MIRRLAWMLVLAGLLATAGTAQVRRLRIVPIPAACPGCVTINVGDTWQTAVTAGAVGQGFLIKTGMHRLQSVAPKNNQFFVGEPGAIMSGAKILTSATGSNPWTYTGQTQQGTVNNESGFSCQAGHDPICAQPEDLFYDGVPLEKVASTGAGGTGKFYFDYTADIIYIWDTPVGHVVETSVTPQAFVAGASTGVRITGLVVQNYATPTTVSAIEMGQMWIVESSEVRYNHYSGIFTTTSGIVRYNFVHHNGDMGLNGSGSNILIDANEVAYNNVAPYAYYNPGQAGGGSKWVFTDHLTVRGNYAHHNYGPGLWTDINNIFVLYAYNTADANCDSGIFHEVSYDAQIEYNTARGNGTCQLFPDWMFGSGIAVSSSRNVEIHDNVLVNNWQGIGILETGRSGEGENSGPWVVTNLNVHDNIVNQTIDQGAATGITGIVRAAAAITAALPTYTTANNHFTHNTYQLGSYTTYFHWNDGTYSAAAWRGFGHDTTGTFTP